MYHHHHHRMFFFYPYSHRRGHRGSSHTFLLATAIVAGFLALLILIGAIGTVWVQAHTPNPQQVQVRALALINAAPMAGNGIETQDIQNVLTVSESLPITTTDANTAIQEDCYQVQSTLWQDSQVNGVEAIQLDVFQEGQEIGVCDLSQQVAHGIAWNTAAPSEVWGQYDTAWIASGV